MKPIKPETLALSYFTTKTDIGRLHLDGSETHLWVLAFDDNWPKLKTRLEREARRRSQTLRLEKTSCCLFEKTLSELHEFLGGKRRDFTIPCLPLGTEFEQKAWQELRKIPYGNISSYSNQARKLKRPQAIRAVAAANGRNPISILIPCHRVLGKNGALTGYAGGLEIKEELLALESLAPR